MNVIRQRTGWCVLLMAVSHSPGVGWAKQSSESSVREAIGLAEGLQSEGQWSDAKKLLDEQLERCATGMRGRMCRVFLNYALGILHEEKGGIQDTPDPILLREAAAYFQTAVADSVYMSAVLALARVYRQLGEGAKLEPVLQRAKERDSLGAARYALLLGDQYGERGNWDGAVQEYREAATLNPQSETPRYRLVGAYRELDADRVSELYDLLVGWEPREGGLRAGMGRADITPPPGVGLLGYGPDGMVAAGYRHRLHARALVLEDANGERIALVVADLSVISPMLHRLVAAMIQQQTGIGADRLILSATHIHSGPSHYLESWLFNRNGSRVPGFDPAMLEFLGERIAEAILDAAHSLRPARAAWGVLPIWGHTYNRSYDAFRRNDPAPLLPVPPADLDLTPAQRAVDPRWTMLRVDLRDPEGGNFEPAGAFSIFAMHGVGNPAVNDLFDGDIQGVVSRGLERHIDSLNSQPPDFQPRAVHLIANGASGDVSPSFPEASRCYPKPRRLRRPGGPRTPPAPVTWSPDPRYGVATCLTVARAFIDSVGDELTRRSVALFDSLGQRLTGNMSIARAFRTLRFVTETIGEDQLVPFTFTALQYSGTTETTADICQPRIGTPTIEGPEGGYTRYRGRVIAIPQLPLPALGKASCHGAKSIALGSLQGMIAGQHGFPEIAQLSVISIGDMLLGTVSGEPTAGAGAMMRDVMAQRAEREGIEARDVALIGLTNGDLNYLTTEAEYGAQRYEGASTLYGPKSAVVVASHLEQLVGELRDAQDARTEVEIDAFTIFPGVPEQIMPLPGAGPPADSIDRRIDDLFCAGDTLVATWIDAYPGRMVPADGPVLKIQSRSDTGAWTTAVWDDHRSLEIRAIESDGANGYLWEARWTPRRASGPHRVVLVARPQFETIESAPFQPCSGVREGRSPH